MASHDLTGITPPVKAGMPGMAVGQAPSMLNVLAPSRASPLPQGFCLPADLAYTQHMCGSEPARDGGGSGV